jgi:hypothetical protein
MSARLVCTGQGTHRPLTVYAYDGTVPVPAGWSPRLPGSTFDLNCPRCRFTPRPGDEGMRALIEMATGRPGGVLDVNPPRS